jgi:hypothetical protein
MTMNAISLVLLSLLAQAQAQPTDLEGKARAQALLKEGSQYYQQGAFTAALQKFEQAYAVFPSPKLLFNIGKTDRELGRPVDAIDAFEKFLAQATDATPEQQAEARGLVEELSGKIGKLLIDCTLAGAEISVDGKFLGRAPLPDLVRVMPGNHQVTAVHPSAMPDVKNVTVAAGTVETVVMRPQATVGAAPPLPPPAAPMPSAAPVPLPLAAPEPLPAPSLDVQQPAASVAEREEGWLLGRKWTWVAAGSTVVFATGAIIAGTMMQAKFDELRSSCGKGAGVNWTGCSKSDYDSLDARKNAANVFWGLTAAAAVTTGVLFYFEGRPVTVAPMVGRAKGMLAELRY